MHIGVSFKMYLDRPQTRAWCSAVAELAGRHPAICEARARLVIFPTLPAMESAMAACTNAPIAFGAQDLFWEDRGAYTGAVSGVDLADMGCSYAEIGHAERRRIFGETDDIVAKKVAAAARSGLTPWLCVGEWDEMPAVEAAAFCTGQLQAALAELPAPVPLVVAYEPVWAIGQAEAASARHVTQVVHGIKSALGTWPGFASTPVVYGGSAAPGTLTALGSAVDGLFLGRFAHDTIALGRILDEVLQTRS